MLDPWFKRQYPLKHLKKWLYWPWGEYRVLRDAQGVLFTSEEERRLARQSFWLYRCRELVLGYGITAPPPPEPGQGCASYGSRARPWRDNRGRLSLCNGECGVVGPARKAPVRLTLAPSPPHITGLPCARRSPWRCV
jgi:hypothetical protein